MKNPHSKNLRKGRVFIPGQYYAITKCCKNGSNYLIEGSCQDNASSMTFTVFKNTIHWLNENNCWVCKNFVMMPNHVHLVLRLGPLKALEQVMAGFSRFTSRKIKSINRINEVIWEESFYDHGIRNEESYLRQLNYVLHNPVRKGLVEEWQDWPFLFTELLKG